MNEGPVTQTAIVHIGELLTMVPAGGDPLEIMSTLWYHDHRQDFTAQNVAMGLAGFYLLFDDRVSTYLRPGISSLSLPATTSQI